MSPHPKDQIDDEEDEDEEPQPHGNADEPLPNESENNHGHGNQQEGGAHDNEIEEMMEQLAIDAAEDKGWRRRGRFVIIPLETVSN